MDTEPTIEDVLIYLAPGARWSVSYSADRCNYEIAWDDNKIKQPDAAKIEAELGRLRSRWEAETYARNRASEYPPLSEFADALYWANESKPEPLKTYYAACRAVKQRHQKQKLFKQLGDPINSASNSQLPKPKLPAYSSMFSASRNNGVFMLHSSADMVRRENINGPLGVDLRPYKISRFETAGILGFAVVWMSPKAFIVYAEGSKATEASWLARAKLATQSLAELLQEIAESAHSPADSDTKKLAQDTIDSLELSHSFLASLQSRSRGKSLHPSDEAKLVKQFSQTTILVS